MKTLFRPMLVIFTVLTAMTGLAYPAVMTAFGQAAFHHAGGSMETPLEEFDGDIAGHIQGRIMKDMMGVAL